METSLPSLYSGEDLVAGVHRPRRRHHNIRTPLFYSSPHKISITATVVLHQTLSFVPPRLCPRICAVLCLRQILIAMAISVGMVTLSPRLSSIEDENVLHRGTRLVTSPSVLQLKLFLKNPILDGVRALYTCISCPSASRQLSGEHCYHWHTCL